MRGYTLPELTYLQSRRGYVVHILIWVTARKLSTGVTESIGLWTGDQDSSFVIKGQTRAYIGASGLLQPDPLIYEVGLAVRTLRVRLASLASDVINLVNGYDLTLAPVEMHRALFDLDTSELIAEPKRVFAGFIDGTPQEIPAIGGEASLEFALKSAAFSLSKTSPLKKSDAVQKKRGGDRLHRYQAVSGTVRSPWGAK